MRCRYAASCLCHASDDATLTSPHLSEVARVDVSGSDRGAQWLALRHRDLTNLGGGAFTRGVPAPAPPPPPPDVVALTAEQQQSYEGLWAWRTQRAAATGVPAELLTPKRVLTLIAAQHMSPQVAASLSRSQPVPCGWA